MNIFTKARIYSTMFHSYSYSKELDQLLEELIQKGKVESVNYIYSSVTILKDGYKYKVSTEGFPTHDLDMIDVYDIKNIQHPQLKYKFISNVRPSKKMKVRFWEFLETCENVDTNLLQAYWTDRLHEINNENIRSLLKG